MAKDTEALSGYVELSQAASALLLSNEKPIVLLPKSQPAQLQALAPDNPDLGVMLPYTPLQHLLFAEGAPELLVMTSANRSGEPMVYRDQDLPRLEGLAEFYLVSDRPIARRVDDSIVALADQKPMILRRARGFAPAPILRSHRYQQPILALGAMLKNAIALGARGQVLLSQHLGDLEELEARLAFRETIHDLAQMYQVNLEQTLIAHDLHPDYPSSQYAAELPGPKLAVQHHQAHIASVLAEHQHWSEPVLGFAFDSAGLGQDGAVWGGEVFYGSLEQGLKRVAHLKYAPLLGGDAAAAFPPQAALGFLQGLTGWESLLPGRLVRQGTSLLASRLPIPRTSSMGRLFDTVAALLGFHQRQDFEGQAPIWLENLARAHGLAKPQSSLNLPLVQSGGIFQWDYHPLLEVVLDWLNRVMPKDSVAWQFHAALAAGVGAAAQALREVYPCSWVALSGGVWQNRLLHQLTLTVLKAQGFTVLWNQAVPPGDGGLALGQLALAQTLASPW